MQQFLGYLLDTLLVITSLFLICLVLIQRGKGGGLAGAFGAPGGGSAFGTKAGDIFTRITMITAGIWITLSMLLVVLSNQRTSAFTDAPSSANKSAFAPSKDGDAKAGKDAGKAGLEPPPVNVPATTKSVTPPAPPISGGSPSAPLPPTQLPTTTPK